MKKEKIIFKNNNGEKIVGDLYNPDSETDKVVIFCHGYGSTKESSKVPPLAEKLTKAGFELFAFDFTNLGESELVFADSTITKHMEYLKSALDLFPNKKIGVIGSSLGGIITLQQTIRDNRINTLALLSPVPVFPHKNTGDYSEESIKEWKEKGFIMTERGRFGMQRINYCFYEDGIQYNDYNVYNQIKIPVFLIHGTADKSIAVEKAKKLTEHIENCKVIILEGADHRYTNPKDFDRMIKETTRFLVKELK